MFRRNNRHVQNSLFGDITNLTPRARADLEASWAGVFYREFFCRLDEQPFAVLYSGKDSRPNTPVNVLIGLEVLKSGFGWSDAEMYDHFRFDVQVRFALGLRTLGEGEFDLRTVYNLRRRLSQHRAEKGVNLLDQAFADISDEQVSAFQLQTHCLRMDSTQVASNIARMARVELLVEILQRVHRMLSEVDQERYAELLAPYLRGSSSQYMYHLRGEDTKPHLQCIGEAMHRLLVELASTYGEHDTYLMLQRVFLEQYDIQADPVRPKPGQAISPRRLRSPDDPEATYRRKGSQAYEGFVANVTETCTPDNPLQLITKVQVAPNVTEDTTLLAEALPELKARTGVNVLYTDAGFCGADADAVLHEQHVEQVPTDLRGRAPNPERLNLADFAIQSDAQGQPQQITCPQGHTVPVETGDKAGHFAALFAANTCLGCPQADRCPTRKRQRDGRRSLGFDQRQLDIAQRRRRSAAYRKAGQNLRSAIEATIGAIKRPFTDDQLPVRGCFRLAMVLIGAAAMVNIRRIQRYLSGQGAPKPAPQGAECSARRAEAEQDSPVSLFGRALLRLLAPLGRLQPLFALSC